MATIIWTALFIVALSYFLFQIWGRFAVLLKMRKDDGRDYSLKTFSTRIKNTLTYGVGQKKFFTGEQPAGILHVLIFWGFIVLSVQVVTMFARGWVPDFVVPGFSMSLLGGVYGFTKDFFEVLVMLGVSFALYRWLVVKPTRLYGFLPAEEKLRKKSHAEAFIILCFIFTIMLSGLLYDAASLILRANDPEIELERKWQPISYFISTLFGSNVETAQLVSSIAWWTHNLVILTFLNLLPQSKHFHIITALLNIFFGKIEPKGKLAKRDLTSDNPLFGRSQSIQFTWKQTLDMYSCTECGRCSSVCPATATGKPLAPRQFLLNLRDNTYLEQTKIIKKTGTDSTEFTVVVGDNSPVIDEVIWSCVTCRACEEACPVNIEYVDKIVDIRQHLVQEASRFPAELNRAFKGMETNSNPWGMASGEREAWANGLNVPKISEKPDAEYLYYVGCGGSFDSNNKTVTQSFIQILQKANVSFAILGNEEVCNGETARRLGNEYLYQTMAEALVQKINSYNVKKILVNCPHCFNTMSNEYPDFGGKWEVIRAADFVKGLINDGKIKIDKSFDKKVVYHDSCYYGRHNNVFDEQRDVVNSVPGIKFEEIKQSRENSTCCGAGGGRMWMEEPKDQRVNIMRTEQALEKSPDVIATSCPFCKIMIGSAVNEKGVNDKVQVMDVMEIVAKNL
jgi:Fe-S oxidoreductase